jgi:hypothetical protein
MGEVSGPKYLDIWRSGTFQNVISEFSQIPDGKVMGVRIHPLFL